MRAEVQVSGDWDCPALIFRFGLPQTDHLNHGILHTMVVVDPVDNDFFNLALGGKVAHLGCLSEYATQKTSSWHASGTYKSQRASNLNTVRQVTADN